MAKKAEIKTGRPKKPTKLQKALKGPEYESSVKWVTPPEKIKDNSQKFSEKLFTMGEFTQPEAPSGMGAFARAFMKLVENIEKPIPADQLADELTKQVTESSRALKLQAAAQESKAEEFRRQLAEFGNPVQPETDLPEVPQQVKELYQSSERLCLKVAELEKALESVLKGAPAIVKAEPKDACSPLGRDLSQLNARLSGLNETVETVTLRLAI